MIHPIFRLMATKPELLLDHLGGYAELVTAQARDGARAMRWQAVLATAAVVSLLLGLGLAGVSVLLVAAVPVDHMPRPWLLVALPTGLWVTAALCWWGRRQASHGWSLSPLREQWHADASLLDEMGRS